MAEGGVELWGKFGLRGRGALALCTLLLKMVAVHTRCFWSKSWVCEMLFGELPFQYNHHSWWRLLGSDWRRNGVCNVLDMFDDNARKSRGNKLTRGLGEQLRAMSHHRSSVPFSSLFLSSFICLFAGLCCSPLSSTECSIYDTFVLQLNLFLIPSVYGN